MKFLRRIRSLFRKDKLDAEMAEEMRHHVEMQTGLNLKAGMTAEDARYAAIRQFGNVASIQEQARENRSWVWLEQFGQDLCYAVRQLRRNPGFTVTVVLVLALGIGANTAIFSLVDSLLFRPLPVKNPAGLLAVNFINPEGQTMGINISAPFRSEYQDRSRLFAALTGYARITVSLRSGEISQEQFAGQIVPGNYFPVLGIAPMLGRVLNPDDDLPDREPVAVISYECWQGVFGRDRDVVGKVIQLNKQSLTVVGVAPRGFYGLNSLARASVWVPTAQEKAIAAHTVYAMVGRLAPTVSKAQAEAELDTLTRQISSHYGERAPPGYERYGGLPRNYRPLLRPAALGSLGAQTGSREKLGKMAGLFAGAVGLVLLAACANAANLLLVRALSRRREIAVRLTLGATRLRLLRQLLIESLLLALLAGMAGLLLAQLGLHGLLALRAGNLAQFPVEAQLDVRVLAFTSGLAVITGLIFGLIPARRSLDFDLHTTLKQETPGASARHRHFALRNLMVLAQVAAGLVLLIGAGLCLRSFANLIHVDPGFDTRNVLTMMIGLDRAKFPADRAQALVEQMLKRTATLPGVQTVSLSDHMLPLSGNSMRRGVDQLEDYAKKPGENIVFDGSVVGPGYFRLLGVQLRQGREFDERDTKGRPAVALVNESFVRRYWPGQNPMGKRVEDAEVIGVVADIRSEQVWLAPEPRVYSPILRSAPRAFTLLVRTEGDPQMVAPLLRRELEALDPVLKSARQNTLQGLWSDSLAGQRMILALLSVFAGLALGMAALGLYGFVACSVAQRTREIGIRMAIGAQHSDILKLVMSQGMALVVAGLSVGLTLAWVATRALEKTLYDVTPTDPLTFAGVSVFLAAVALTACWLPARRAAKVDPMIALRAE